MEDIFYSEESYPLNKFLSLLDKEQLYYLCKEKKIKVSIDCEKLKKENLSEGKIRFTNYCGYLNKELTHLVIPKKLIELWGLNPEDKEEFKKVFNEKFEKFLWKVLNNLSHLELLFNLSTASFPVEETPKGENLIFQILVLLEFSQSLEENLGWIIADPHRELVKRETYKPIEEVNELEPAVVVDIVQNPHRWVETPKGILKARNKRFAPTEVLQFEYIETHDTVENRFIKRLLEEILFILETAEGRFLNLPPQLVYLKETVAWYLQTTFLREVGSLKQIPYHSKVLQRKPGYRELFKLWRLLHTSFVPSFYSKLDLVFALKDMATLWEYYVLTVLLRELKEIYGPFEVEIDFEEKTLSFYGQTTTYEEALFLFPNGLTLHFQKTLRGYSNTKFRPDFLIEWDGNRYIFDAKFRIMEKPTSEEENQQYYRTRKEVLINMHYYRDALRSKFSVALSVSNSEGGDFYSVEGEKLNVQTLKEFLENLENYEGVGFLNLPI
jgi:predicted component of viral defense system (DUF524 family)